MPEHETATIGIPGPATTATRGGAVPAPAVSPGADAESIDESAGPVSGCVVDVEFAVSTSFGPAAGWLRQLITNDAEPGSDAHTVRVAVANCLGRGVATLGITLVRRDPCPARLSVATIDVQPSTGVGEAQQRAVVTSRPNPLDRPKTQDRADLVESVAAAMMLRSPGMMFVLDEEQRIVIVNRRAAVQLDIDAEKVIGQTPIEAFPSGDYRRDVLLAGNAEAEVEGYAFTEIMRPLPATTLLRVDKYPFRKDGCRYLAISARDTPLSPKPHRRSAARELQLLQLVDLIPAPIWVINNQRRIIRLNEAARSLATTTTSALIGSSVYTVYPESGAEVFGPPDADFVSLATSGQSAPVFSSPSNERLFRVDRTILPGLGSPTSAMAVMLTDLSEVHGARQELQMKNEVLEHRNAELDQFAHMASHDLRAPLRAIYAFTQMAMEEEGDEHRDHLGAILGSVDRMRSVLDSLLDYATADTKPVFEQVALADVVASVLGDLASDIAVSGAAIKVGELPVLQCDETSMRRLFQNLIANAITYAGDEPPSITITSTPEYRFVEIVVTDRGIGFPQHQEDDVFRPFKRLSADSVGQGIGLSMCRRIVESHHGTIRAISQLGGPTSMVIRLPRRRSL